MRGISVPPGATFAGGGRRPQTERLGLVKEAKIRGEQSSLGIGCQS